MSLIGSKSEMHVGMQTCLTMPLHAGENSRAEDENSRPMKWHTLLGAALGVNIFLGYTASCQALCSEPCSKRPLFEQSSQLTNFGIERRDLS